MKKVIETDRLYLRELVVEDKKALSKVLSDPESMEYYPEPFSDEKVEHWIQRNLDNYEKYNHGMWAVILKDGDVFLGDCGITMQNIDGEILPELGFHIIKEYCNHGYATEAALACKDYTFDTLKLPSLFSYTTVDNVASQKVAQNVGMKQYKVFERDGKELVAQVIYNNK